MKSSTIHSIFAAAVTLALTACAGNTVKEVDQIRIRRQLHHKVITEHYIIIFDDRVPYLATFQRRCRELNEPDVKPDVRHESRKLRARFDTYRGCKIRTLHEVTSGQAEELLDLGAGTINE